jgi:putative acyl-CoA dehydrogenase
MPPAAGTNQPPPLVNYNLFDNEPALAGALRRYGAAWAEEEASRFGAVLGGEEAIHWGFQANDNPPVLRTHDRFGERIDQVEFHPAWHELMGLSMRHGLHSLPWTVAREGAHVARAALLMLAAQNECGHTCPISMTCAAAPVLRLAPELAAEWEPRITSNVYDRRFLPAAGKTSATIGMAMTERQGGSDVRANTTRAERIDGAGYAVTGCKWFCSAPMSDAFLVLAQAPGGLTCFFVPRWTPGGRVDGFHLQRLKQKLGNRSNASAEVAFDHAWARRVGEEGRGVQTIIEMVNYTRLDCVIASAALMRQAVIQALHHARWRRAFGKLLIEQPLMRGVLADLALESEAATLLAMRLARAFDRRHADPEEQAFARLATPVAKYWICKRACAVTGEALECIGGNGYVEECVMPRLYREAPLNSIWEGSGNVICLDAQRAMRKEPQAAAALFEEIRLARGANRHCDLFLDALESQLQRPPDEAGARRAAEQMAVALQASLMLRFSAPAAADAFCAGRLAGEGGRTFGTLPAGSDFAAILAC